MQQVWRKRWRNTAWFTLAAVTLVLLVSAVHKKNNKTCKGIEVTFKDNGNNFFIEEKGVEDVLKANGLIAGQPLETIDLKALEATLKNDKWIADAQLFFDNNQVLQVIVEEKTPVARIFTSAGSSFYIDSACRKLPLSEKLSARIPMFTSFPTDRAKLSKPDSELLASVKELAMFIQADDFWKAQVAQIDITPDGFEMIPTVGNHAVELGKDGDWQQKFDRLFSFYKQVWTKVGFEKYEKIDVRFEGQVVATLKGTKPAIVDSAKVRTAYEDLFADVRKDSALYAVQVTTKDTDTKAKAGVIKKTPMLVTAANNGSATEGGFEQHNEKNEIIKQQLTSAEAKQLVKDKQTDDKKMPKAVMKKRL
jgi:cell division protein FtsQ